jgi:hypothetical protein
VFLPAPEEVKISLYEAMREAGLLDLRHHSRLDHIEDVPRAAA